MKVQVIGLDYSEWELTEYKGKTETLSIPSTDDIQLAIETLGEAEYHALAMRAVRTAFVNHSNRAIKEGNFAKLYKLVFADYPDEINSRMAEFEQVKAFVNSKKHEYNI